MDKQLLESIMCLHGDTVADLAKALGISRQSFCMKKNETKGREFKQSEITIIRNRYNLTAEQVERIFFAQKVS